MGPLELIEALRLQLKEDPLILASSDEVTYFSLFSEKEKKNRTESVPKQITPVPPSFSSVSKKEVILPPEEKIVSPPPPPIEKKEPAVNRFSSLKEVIAKAIPSLAIFEQIPNDALAKKIATRWKAKNQAAPISLLFFEEPPPYKMFLEELATALEVYFGACSLIQAESIEREKQWDSFLGREELRLIIISDATLWQLPTLRTFYKEVPASSLRFLQKAPLFLLPDPALYFKDSFLKRSLWDVLCKKLQK
ncbi:MAG TPA: hypothetical protein VJK48_00345 [Chlamydiales bacterium]|nr:hypothetical protein [Chlamydiales bacterium]